MKGWGMGMLQRNRQKIGMLAKKGVKKKIEDKAK